MRGQDQSSNTAKIVDFLTNVTAKKKTQKEIVPALIV
jgi:hypothetical protein